MKKQELPEIVYIWADQVNAIITRHNALFQVETPCDIWEDMDLQELTELATSDMTEIYKMHRVQGCETPSVPSALLRWGCSNEKRSPLCSCPSVLVRSPLVDM